MRGVWWVARTRSSMLSDGARGAARGADHALRQGGGAAQARRQLRRAGRAGEEGDHRATRQVLTLFQTVTLPLTLTLTLE